MSPAFFRNWARIVVLSLVALSGVAVAQVGLQSDGYKLLKAVRDRDGAVVNEIVQKPNIGTLINTRDLSSGETVLHIVAARRDTPWIRFLTAYGADPNLADKKGETPLMISTRLGHVEGVTELLEAGAHVDPVSNGETPLIVAVHGRDLPVVRVLLANGADPERTDNSGRSARDYVAQIGDRRLAEAFANADAEAKQGGKKQYGPSF
ncbi:ankyrin repeat domain-containing protein [Citromicrobium sp. WPS32]|uniref:ankyrin repeat domain-containing protein n=1 Tax=Citromicrobium sp. WPS32 TaxID=1634517 RepID=UPI000A801D66|nr:ankyrin repeat domain-containing protein [Citromicrobium sp. WPS32]